LAVRHLGVAVRHLGVAVRLLSRQLNLFSGEADLLVDARPRVSAIEMPVDARE